MPMIKRTVTISALFCWICCTAGATIPPSLPANLSAVLSGSSVYLSWNPATDSAGVIKAYNVIRNGQYVNWSLGTSYVDTPGPGTWTYQVLAYDTNYNLSGFSAAAQITVPPSNGAPSVPTNLSAVLSSSNVYLSWSPSTDYTGVIKAYNVFRN